MRANHGSCGKSLVFQGSRAWGLPTIIVDLFMLHKRIGSGAQFIVQNRVFCFYLCFLAAPGTSGDPSSAERKKEKKKNSCGLIDPT